MTNQGEAAASTAVELNVPPTKIKPGDHLVWEDRDGIVGWIKIMVVDVIVLGVEGQQLARIPRSATDVTVHRMPEADVMYTTDGVAWIPGHSTEGGGVVNRYTGRLEAAPSEVLTFAEYSARF